VQGSLMCAFGQSVEPVAHVGGLSRGDAVLSWLVSMLPKIAHVIIVGLSEEERGELDRSTRKILHFSDPSWEYTSYGCSTLDEAAKMAKDMTRVDIFYIARERPFPLPGEKSRAELDYEILAELMRDHPSKPVVTYPNPARQNKLATAIFALWRDRNAAALQKAQSAVAHGPPK
jgi:hypothetical protein